MSLPEYGRNVQKMVDHIKTIEDRNERNRAAKTIIQIMGNLNPHLRDIGDFKHKLWDHLAIISDFELDIDYPYEIPQREMFQQPPRQVEYGTHRMLYRHYGHAIEMMINAVCDMPEEENKSQLINTIANHMKKSYVIWNRNSVSDEVILKDLKKLSKGRADVSEVKLLEVREPVVPSKKRSRRNNPRKK